MDTVIVDLHSLCMALDLDHYHPAADGPAAEVDRPIAEATICERCKAHCTYVAYTRLLPRGYVAIAACWPCNRGYLF